MRRALIEDQNWYLVEHQRQFRLAARSRPKISLKFNALRSNEQAALVSGRYWRRLRQEQAAKEAFDETFQDRLVSKLAELTRVVLPGP